MKKDESKIQEIDTSYVGEEIALEKKFQPSFLQRFSGIIIGLIVLLLMLLPLFTIKEANQTVDIKFYEVFFGSAISKPAIIIFIAFFFPLIAGILYFFANRYAFLNLIALIFSIAAIAIFIFSPDIFYEINGWGDSAYEVNISIGAIFSAILAGGGALFSIREFSKQNPLTIRDITEIAAMVGIALLLDQFVKIDVTGAGAAGSIGFAMLPLFILAFRLGFLKGFIASGVVFGLLSNIIDGYGFATYPFDYLLAFGLIGVVGLFRSLALPKNKNPRIVNIIWYVIAIIIGAIGRYFGSVISSLVIYDATLSFALSYNWYILASGGAVLIILLALYKPLLMINARYPTSEDRIKK